MQIPIPWGLIAIFISLVSFYYFNQKKRLKNQDRRNRLNEKRHEYIDAFTEKNQNKNDENN